MSIGREKQNISVFLGSTYEDLKDYRQAVQNVLNKLEAIVKGMEFFGSTPNTPLDECLKKVADSKIYIGIFAMRYGSIEEKTGKSFTHLEYEEAQRLNIPILIYIIDELNQPILPIYVDTGEKAERLKSLKNELRKRYTISTFTSPDDLARKISTDLPKILEEITNNIIESTYSMSDLELYNRFVSRPQKYFGAEITLKMNFDGSMYPIASAWAKTFALKDGSAVYTYASLYIDENIEKNDLSALTYNISTSDTFMSDYWQKLKSKVEVMFDNELADWYEKHSPIGDFFVKVRLLYGKVLNTINTINGPVPNEQSVRSLLVLEIPKRCNESGL